MMVFILDDDDIELVSLALADAAEHLRDKIEEQDDYAPAESKVMAVRAEYYDQLRVELPPVR